MQNKGVIPIMATLGLLLSMGALTILYSQNVFAQISNTGSGNGGISGATGGSSGATGGSSGATGGSSGVSTGQSGGGGGSSGNTIGSTGQSVDRHLFCNTGVITPICK